MEINNEDNYYIYILRCEDDSLYTGIAKDYKKRYIAHIEGKGAKYTRSRKPIKIERVWKTNGRSEASKVEYFLKKHTRGKKLEYIGGKLSFKTITLEKLSVEIEEEKIN